LKCRRDEKHVECYVDRWVAVVDTSLAAVVVVDRPVAVAVVDTSLVAVEVVVDTSLVAVVVGEVRVELHANI
jgi:hypothetical protein